MRTINQRLSQFFLFVILINIAQLSFAQGGPGAGVICLDCYTTEPVSCAEIHDPAIDVACATTPATYCEYNYFTWEWTCPTPNGVRGVTGTVNAVILASGAGSSCYQNNDRYCAEKFSCGCTATNGLYETCTNGPAYGVDSHAYEATLSGAACTR